MKLKFLSDEWLEKLSELADAAEGIPVPTSLAGININLNITGSEYGDKQLCLRSGILHPGHEKDAKTSIKINNELAKKIFIENDPMAAIKGMLSGKVKVKGNLRKLMALQSKDFTKEQLEFGQRLADLTT